MKIVSKFFLILQLIFTISFFIACDGKETITSTDYESFKVIELDFEGKNAEEVGIAYGKWIKENYPDYISDYTTYFMTLKSVIQQQYLYPTDEEIENRIAYLLPTIPQKYKDEIMGIAKGLGDSNYYDLLLKMNLIPDVLRPVSCSSFAVYGDVSSTGETIMARNLDWWTFNILNKYSAVIVYRNQEGKNDFLNIAYVGIGSIISGINKNEMGAHIQDVGINTLFPYDGERYSYTFTIRESLENCENVNEALDLFQSRNFVYSFNTMFFDEDEGLAYERSVEAGNGTSLVSVRTPGLTDVRTEWGMPDRIAVTNHYETTTMDSLQYNYNQDSVLRFERIRDLMTEYSIDNKFTVDSAKSIITYTGDDINIYKSVIPGQGDYFGTQESYIYDCKDNKLYFFAAAVDGITSPEYVPLTDIFE